MTSIIGLLMIMVVALIPANWLWGVGSISGWLIPDKWLHGVTFAFLTFWFCGQYERAAYWRVVLGLVAFGALIEVCQQALVYRSAETMDLVVDLAGITVGLILSFAATGGWCLRFEALVDKQRG